MLKFAVWVFFGGYVYVCAEGFYVNSVWVFLGYACFVYLSMWVFLVCVFGRCIHVDIFGVRVWYVNPCGYFQYACFIYLSMWVFIVFVFGKCIQVGIFWFVYGV